MGENMSFTGVAIYSMSDVVATGFAFQFDGYYMTIRNGL